MIINPPLIPRMYPRAPGLYYPAPNFMASTTMSPNIGTVYAFPYYSGENPKSSGIAFEVTSAILNGAVDCALYEMLNWSTNALPGKRMAFAGTQDCSTTGVKVVNWTPGYKPMKRNRWYWLAFLNTFAQVPGVRAVSVGSQPIEALHVDSANIGNKYNSIHKIAGGLSDPFGAGVLQNANFPLVLVVAA